MKFYLFLTFLVVAIFSACQKEALEPTVSVPTPPSLFPLAVGNRWVYERNFYNNNDSIIATDTVEYYIDGTTSFNNHTYYSFNSTDDHFHGNNPYISKQGNNYIRRDRNSGLETVFLKDSLSFFETWTEPLQSQAIDTNRTVIVPAGTYNEVIRIATVEILQPYNREVLSKSLDYKAGVGFIRGSRRWIYRPLHDRVLTLELLSYSLN